MSLFFSNFLLFLPENCKKHLLFLYKIPYLFPQKLGLGIFWVGEEIWNFAQNIHPRRRKNFVPRIFFDWNVCRCWQLFSVEKAQSKYKQTDAKQKWTPPIEKQTAATSSNLLTWSCYNNNVYKYRFYLRVLFFLL